MNEGYRAPGTTDFTFDADEISHAPVGEASIAIHYEGAPGAAGQSGSSGFSGSNGTTNSGGTQSPGGNGGGGGPGGNGSHGRNARNGRFEVHAAGTHVFLEEGGNRTQLHGSADLTHDGTDCGGNLTRGSSLTIDAIHVEHRGEFAIPAPFIAIVATLVGLS